MATGGSMSIEQQEYAGLFDVADAAIETVRS